MVHCPHSPPFLAYKDTLPRYPMLSWLPIDVAVVEGKDRNVGFTEENAMAASNVAMNTTNAMVVIIPQGSRHCHW